MSEHSNSVRVAAVQAECCYFDLQGAVAKTCKLIEEAAAKRMRPHRVPRGLDSKLPRMDLVCSRSFEKHIP